MEVHQKQKMNNYLNKNGFDDPPALDDDVETVAAAAAGGESAETGDIAESSAAPSHSTQTQVVTSAKQTRRPRKHLASSDPLNLEQRFFKWGVRPEWLQVHRIINHTVKHGQVWYLVKWKDLPYGQVSWESVDNPCGIVDFDQFVDDYHNWRCTLTSHHHTFVTCFLF